MQFYIAAGSLGVLGPTTLAARLPFAVLGFLAVPLTYLLARRLFGRVAVARLSALFLALSVPFLLHTRQARWCGCHFSKTTSADCQSPLQFPNSSSNTAVIAAAANYGPGWVEVPAGTRRDDLTLRLVADDVPIPGQIINPEGKLVPGTTARMLQINAAPGEDLGP